MAPALLPARQGPCKKLGLQGAKKQGEFSKEPGAEGSKDVFFFRVETLRAGGFRVGGFWLQARIRPSSELRRWDLSDGAEMQ